MTALRIFPFIGALIAIAAVVLAIVGVSTTYWVSTGLNIHAGLWQSCTGDACVRSDGGRPAAFALTALIAIGVAALLAIFSGLARSKSDASNNMARLCGIISVILLFSSGVLIAASLYTYIGVKYATGYSFTLMAIAQFLSFLAAMLVAHWMGHSFTVIS
ncbi:unnamed protein product [Rotaria sordida]|uniref:Uncharacterized protein n=1 Tax=Rotaria sordida TaxID=392033 RepID=A0A818KTP5_9BILA|nr:unnamed protein product [Rotaria sordida]CAF0898733.1 unnamed protein product [Rotaria sordida]CAF1174944.1 unnamed protein product [Rotaria sordida]CAF3556261.1 unnamed protein product [Rotaria sordida]CAF3594030.1 unnamed protein product [Rotaria sordida]